METKLEVNTYLTKRTVCNGTCKYHSFCPEYPPLSGTSNKATCAIVNLGKLDVFYNLFFGEADGLKNEMQRTLYKMENADDPQQYIQACTKTMTTVYGTDSKADIIPPKVAINISKVAISNTKSKKSVTKKEKK